MQQVLELEAERDRAAALLSQFRAEHPQVDDAGKTEAQLNASGAHIAAAYQQHIAEVRIKIMAAQHQIDGIARREAIQAERPAGCVCLGFGGTGLFTMLGSSPNWQTWCHCEDAIRMQVEAEANRAVFFAQLDADLGPDPGEDSDVERLSRVAIDPRSENLDLTALEIDDGKREAFTAAWALLDQLDAQYAARRWEWVAVEGQTGTKTSVAVYPPIVGGRPWLYIYGESGCGKSTLSRAMLARWARQDRPGYMVNMAHWLAQLRASFERRDDVTPTSTILAPVRTKRLVVLDDFGTEPPTEYTRRTLYEVLNYRYECRLPTIITSNAGVIDSVVRLGGDSIENNRLVSRISELAVVRELAGRNFREQLQPPLMAEMAR